METNFNTSFIPKKSLQIDTDGSLGDKYVGRRNVHGPGFFLAMLVFVISTVASLALFGYTKIVESSINDKIKLLQDQKAAFDEKSIEMLVRAEQKINSANTLVTQHIAVSNLFDFIENITLRDVQYKEFQYDGVLGEIIVSGQASTIQDVALQAKSYRESQRLLNPKVTQLMKAESNYADFSLNATVDQQLVLFSVSANPDTKQENNTNSNPVEKDYLDEGASTSSSPSQNTGDGEVENAMPSKKDS